MKFSRDSGGLVCSFGLTAPGLTAIQRLCAVFLTLHNTQYPEDRDGKRSGADL